MTAIETQILESWQMNNRIMLLMIKNIPAEALAATLNTRGGRDIARQLAHVNMVRIMQLESFAKKIKLQLIQFDKEESPSKEKLLQAFEQSGELMEKYIIQCIEKGGAAASFKKGVVPMLAYYVSHEAHHRGNILLTMKQSGHKVPDPLKWGIWEDWRK